MIRNRSGILERLFVIESNKQIQSVFGETLVLGVVRSTGPVMWSKTAEQRGLLRRRRRLAVYAGVGWRRRVAHARCSHEQQWCRKADHELRRHE